MRGAKLVRLAFLAVIAVGIAKLVQALRGPKAPAFTRHPTVDGGPAAAPDAPGQDPSPLAPPVPPIPAGGTGGGAIPELASPAAPHGVLADPRHELAGELAAPEPTPELAAPPTVEALVAETNVAAPPAAPYRWVEPVEGACPEGYPVKAKLRSGIYHAPGGTAYERTKPDRCYASAADAEADGLRPPKR
jgi:hypothetical protein